MSVPWYARNSECKWIFFVHGITMLSRGTGKWKSALEKLGKKYAALA